MQHSQASQGTGWQRALRLNRIGGELAGPVMGKWLRAEELRIRGGVGRGEVRTWGSWRWGDPCSSGGGRAMSRCRHYRGAQPRDSP
jgi:hypothetical protein